MVKIAVVEDTPLVSDLICRALEGEGYIAVPFALGNDLLREFGTLSPDLVILDLGLPDESGIVILRQLRARSNVPIFVVTAETDEAAKIGCLSLGADDYLAKSVSFRELTIRIRNTLERRSNGGVSSKLTFKLGPWTIDGEAGMVCGQDGRRVDLTAMEFRLLMLLLARNGRILSRGAALDALADGRDSDASERFVDALISRIRTKLDDRTIVETVQGMGYRIGPEKVTRL